MRVALKIAYDGRPFHGVQRQPDCRTVEGECLAALQSAGVIRDSHEARLRSASRTDRGVSAVGNVIAFNTSLRPSAVVGAFNSEADGVWAWAGVQVEDSFNPRHSLERWYRYLILDETPHDRLWDAGRLFVGTHDLSSFCSEPLRGPLSINSIDVSRMGTATAIDIRAPYFRRSVVRRVVAAMMGFAKSELELDELRMALAGERRSFGSAPSEALILMDVKYGFAFGTSPARHIEAAMHERICDLSLRLHFVELVRRAAAAEPHQFAR